MTTILINYNGGTYLGQFSSPDVSRAVRSFILYVVDILCLQVGDPYELAAIDAAGDALAPLNGLVGAFCKTLLVNDLLMEVYLVQPAASFSAPADSTGWSFL